MLPSNNLMCYLLATLAVVVFLAGCTTGTILGMAIGMGIASAITFLALAV